MRLGSQLCHLAKGSKAYDMYGSATIHERHRHRYEVNNNLRPQIEKAGLKVSGLSADKKLVEVIENPAHPWFVAAQFHPEFTSNASRWSPIVCRLCESCGSVPARRIEVKKDMGSGFVLCGYPFSFDI